MNLPIKIFKILGFTYLPIEESIITRDRRSENKNSYGIRPKIIIKFSMPFEIYENKNKITMQSTATDINGVSRSFSTIKYDPLSVLSNYNQHPAGLEKYEKERESWLNLRPEQSLIASTYSYLMPDNKIQGNAIFQILFYPCSFLIKEGISHNKLFVEIFPDCDLDYKYIHYGLYWNTYDYYIDFKEDILTKLNNIPKQVNFFRKINNLPEIDVCLDYSAQSSKNKLLL